MPLSMLFPQWGHPPFLPLHLYFTLDGSSAAVANPSQSHLTTQPTASRKRFSNLLLTRPCSLWEKWFRAKQGATLASNQLSLILGTRSATSAVPADLEGSWSCHR